MKTQQMAEMFDGAGFSRVSVRAGQGRVKLSQSTALHLYTSYLYATADCVATGNDIAAQQKKQGLWILIRI
jgi:hypothetical protein